MTTHYRFSAVLGDQGWISPAYVGVDAAGNVAYLSREQPAGQAVIDTGGFVLPGFQNAHSHAFQFGMAGHAEVHRVGTDDDFWSWRDAMYRCALSYDPDQLQAVATNLYRELLRNGYTGVAEFHYQHHDPDGKPYANLAETGERLLAAAAAAGIRITLVPVFYRNGNFGTAASPLQRRFISRTTDDYFRLLESSAAAVARYPASTLGFGVHSLRAADEHDIIRIYNDGPRAAPFHLHVAEQLKEVRDCVDFYGLRPVEWLFDRLPVNDRFNLVHATHLADGELDALARSGATVILCPGTEGNLGDGIFRLQTFCHAGGKFATGTDSQVTLNPLEDLRWLDYGQRLQSHRRNTFANGAAVMVKQAIASGRTAMGAKRTGYFALGEPFDAVVYDENRPLLQQANLDQLLPAIVYTADSSAVKATFVSGKRVYDAGYSTLNR